MDVIKKRRDFLRCSRGKRWHGPAFVVVSAPTPEEGGQQATSESGPKPPRVGFTVSKKVGNAVVRNRVRRRLRAAARQMLPLYGQAGFDYVIIARPAVYARPFECLLDDLKGALIKLGNPAPVAARSGRRQGREG